MAKQIIMLGELIKSAWAKVNANFNELYEGKVDVVSGKGLSTNDYTTAEKEKLAGIAAGAQANVIESVKVNGTALTVTEKAVNIDLSTYAKKSDISSAYIYKGSKATVSALPTTGNTVGDVYNVEENGMNYAWTGTEWDPLGGTIDLSNYVTEIEMNTALSGYVEAEAGKGLSTNDFTNAEKNKLANLSAPTTSAFTTSSWGTVDSDGYYHTTISANGKYPVKVMRNVNGTYSEAIVDVELSGNNVIITSEVTFDGYVVLI